MYKKTLFIVSLLFVFVIAGCTNNKKIEDHDTVQIYTTVYPLQYFAERIGGDAVTVKTIYPPGSDEHTFDPTQKDMIALADADLFFYIGLGLEGFVENAEKTLKNEHVKMVATADSITEDMLGDTHDHDDEHGDNHHDHGEFDPHVWISPVLSDALAFSVKEALVEVSPENKEQFEENFESLRDDLLKLDREFIQMTSEVPTKTFFVSHAAFGYIADTYGLEQVAVAGLNSQSEPSQKQLAQLVEYAKEQNIQYVLFEQNVSSKLTDVIRKEIGAESLTMHNLGVLTTEDIKNRENYFTLMERNIEVLRKALGGE
ncbi:metal ABC transporter substrate-binding protein [Sporosarcina pasteurii]|uniref:Probable zinc transport system zinc-binding lipoprotein AdcA n=1 Tax=Sporosarcina pasteurii TaxID=1474 RepID=A0A380C8U8_SPOPA|nr:metal ABC transporter substrate-binding protein [Sporosarcina pasteurii]MDS9472955.1 metal ABC transporter substrate-binding protein [Sporosarcina pasteurii]QBQ04472.1 adhesin [Sporosarcina pasteurii]SUJ14656.1 Probable zinc transport system zinc-binding lipoprotein AdcA precursor [Sporosarcina pasteurii]